MTQITFRLNAAFNDGDDHASDNFADLVVNPVKYVVPPGSRLVIESIAAAGYVPKGQRVRIWIKAGGDSYDVPLEFRGTFRSVSLDAESDHWVWSSLTRAYVGPSVTLTMDGRRTASTGRGWLWMTVTGTLE